MRTITEVEGLFRSLLPEAVRVAALAVDDAPEESPVPVDLAAARPVRLREFRAGRACAARVLEALAVKGHVGRDAASRAPLWPAGVAGSITHTRELAVAAAGFVPALGIDLEPLLAPDALRDVRASAISDAEWRLLGEDPALATALFSAKESIFKCLWPQTKVFLEFTDAVLIARDPSSLVLRVIPTAEELHVRYALSTGHALTAALRSA